MRLQLALLAICIWQIAALAVTQADDNGQYSVIAPGTLHSARPYTASVSVHHGKPEETYEIKVGITGPLYNESKTVALQKDEVKEVTFDVPALEKGDYNLTAEGVKGLEFKNSTRLNYAGLTMHVKIQTDKGAYKPGDEVNFRVLFLDENLRPAVPHKNVVIGFEDAKRNLIKEYKDFQVVKGVFTEKFQISEFPLLGNWRLVVKNVNRYETQVYFEVSKYVLPKYNVKVESTENVAVQDGDIQVVVRSNYTYGKPVTGKVTLILSMDPQYIYEEGKEPVIKTAPSTIKTTDMVNGKAKFDMNVKEYEEYLPYKTSPAYATITATVEEQFTGVKINGTAGTLIYPYRYHMYCQSWQTCSTYHANKEFEVVFQVLHVDNTEVKDTKSVVKLKYTEGRRKDHWYRGNPEHPDKPEEPPVPTPLQNRTFVFESHLNATSLATFKVTLPELQENDGYTDYFEMELEYANEKREIYQTYQYREPKSTEPKPEEYKEPKDYFKIEPQHEKDRYSWKLSEEGVFKINSSEPLSYFVYHIIGRGNILHSERVELPEKSKIYELKYKPSFFTSPYGKIYVYYVDKKGELFYAETMFHVDVELQNKLEIDGPKETKPGQEVSLKIKTLPNSFVGLLAVDQSVLLHRGNNDVNVHDFQWRLGNHDTSTPWQGGYSRYPGEQAGVITFTNANYFYNMTPPEGHGVLFAADRESALGVRGFSAVAHKTTSASLPQAPQSDGVGAGGAAVSAGGEIAIRKNFVETWIFADIENTETEEFTWSKQIPDTITSWVLTGFSINPDKGIGVTSDKTEIKTFQPFFISIRLPYSVKRGEVINVPALVFNYLDKDLDVDVTLDNADGEYEFTEITNEIINEPKRTKTVRVPAQGAAGVAFLLRPKIIGNILLKFLAVSPIAGDAIHKTLKVVPEGVTEYANRAYFVNLKDAPEFKDTFELALPAEVVPDSEHIEFAVVGDLLGPLLNNLENLVRMPLGCGEQIMSTMVPNLMVLRYLKTIDKLTPALESRIKRNLESGYQHILAYGHGDGSFSSFGPSKDEKYRYNGSTWLTAYVVRSLQQAREIINVDDKVLSQGMEYLVTKQAENGSFVEAGDYFYATQKNHITLTSSVLLALNENATDAEKYQTNIDKGFKYILENLEKTEDLQAKALATYTLQKAKHALAAEQVANLKSLAKTDEDRMWWSDRKDHNNIYPRGGCCFWRWPFSHDVEITSYILLSLLETETVEQVLPIIKWLVAQRNSYGGFASTQDTVVGLQALIKFAEKSGYEPATMDIEFVSKGGKSAQETIKVNVENAVLMQIKELPQKTTAIDFTAKGKGAALVQISYQYNVLEKEKTPSFSINPVINKDTPPFKLEMEVCVEYTGEGGASNMAVLEVSLPSGYVANAESFDQIKEVDRVRQVETKNGETVVVVYFESLPKGEPKCLPIEAFKSFQVALQKPAAIVLYDYYETNRKANNYYEVASKLCDLCLDDDEKCKEACN